MTIKTILCPIDLSPASIPVLSTALAIAQREDAKVTVVHVLEPLLAQASALAFEKGALEQVATNELLTLIGKTAPEVGLEPDTVGHDVRFGEPYEAILAAIEKDDPDLVVMGTRGFRGARKLFFGSTAARVLAKSTRPVLSVPSDGFDPALRGASPAFGLTRIVVAVNFTEVALHAIEPAADLARKWGLPLVLVHIVEHALGLEHWREMLDDHHARRTDRARRELELIARDIPGVPVAVISTGGTPEEAIVEIAGREPGALIALGLPATDDGRSAFQLGSTAYRLLCLTRRPVLIFPVTKTHKGVEKDAALTTAAASGDRRDTAR
jgi:nucleotide-binding universal stress UspA family protein